MFILLPSQPKSPDAVDRAFADEMTAAVDHGFSCGLYHYDALMAGDATGAVAALPRGNSTSLIVRGWMVPGETFASLFLALRDMGYCPVVDPQAYEEAHYLPLAYQHIEHETARSKWISGDDFEMAWELYQDFRDKDAVIKDWVKSAKNRWKSGCFIPAGTSEAAFREIFAVFRAERGKRFNRGVVLREFLPVVVFGRDLRGFPVTEETRLFMWNGRVLVWPRAASASDREDMARWGSVAARFSSPFISIDIARLIDGDTKIIEVGDGGVSGLPMGLLPSEFYEALRAAIHTGLAPGAG